MSPHFLEYLRLLYTHRFFIGGVTLAVFVVAAILELSVIKNDYAAEVVLVKTSPELGSEKMSKLIPPAFHTKAFEELVRSTAVLGGVFDDAVAQGVWADEGDIPDPEMFRTRMRASSEIIDETTRPVNYAPYLTLSATDADPEVAKKLVDLWATRALEAAARSNELAIETATATLSRQESNYRDRLDTALGEQAIEKAQFNLTVLKAELDDLVQLVNREREKLLNAKTQLASEEERLRTVREELESEPEFLYLWRSPSDDVFWLEELGSAGEGTERNRALKELGGKGLLNQQTNPVYQALKQSENSARSEIAKGKAAVTSIESQLEQLEIERQTLQESIAEHELIQLRFERQIKVFDQIYLEIAELDAFVMAASELVRPREDDSTLPVGYNRLSSETYTREAIGFTTGKLRVGFLTLVGFVLAAGYVIGRREWARIDAEPTGDAVEIDATPR